MRLLLQVQDAEVKNMHNIYFALILNNVKFVKWSVLYFFSYLLVSLEVLGSFSEREVEVSKPLSS